MWRRATSASAPLGHAFSTEYGASGSVLLRASPQERDLLSSFAMNKSAFQIRARRPGTSVLIVDDDADGREALERLLRFAGYAVACCGNGGEALECLRSAERLPDVILLDAMMPVMDGAGFRKEQKKDRALAAIPVVVVSAQGDLQATLDAEAYLDKPLEFRSLVETLDRIVPELPSDRAIPAPVVASGRVVGS
jgi:CheY-like chemotaxis protein